MNAVVSYREKSIEELKALTGQFVGGSDDYLPQVMINKEPEDRDGNEVPVGTLFVKTKDNGFVYMKRKTSALFRPYIHRRKYEVYDDAQKKIVSSTILFSSYREEILSDDGTLKCGKGSAELEAKKLLAKCKQIIYGTISFTGVTNKGVEVQVVDLPCWLKIGGRSFSKVDDLSKDADKRKALLFDNHWKVEVVSSGNGIYGIDVNWVNLTEKLPFDEKTEENLRAFAAIVETYNKRVTKKFEQARKNVLTKEEKNDTVVDAAEDLAQDFVEDVEVE